MDVTGAGLDSSIIGNTLDRGFGHTRYGDHALTTCGMEVVLGDGQVFQTGLGHYENAKANRAYRYGVGPTLDTLFTQSNFGIVTQMGIYLMPHPRPFATFFIAAENETDLAAAGGWAGEPADAGNSAKHDSHRQRSAGDFRENALSIRASEPTDAATSHAARKAAKGMRGRGMERVRLNHRHASNRRRHAQRRLRRALRGFKIIFLDDRRLALAERICRALNGMGLAKGIAHRLEIVKPVYGLLKGIPTNETLRGAGVARPRAASIRAARSAGLQCRINVAFANIASDRSRGSRADEADRSGLSPAPI